MASWGKIDFVEEIVTPDEMARWKCGLCAHPETVTGLRSDCLQCWCDLVRSAEEEQRKRTLLLVLARINAQICFINKLPCTEWSGGYMHSLEELKANELFSQEFKPCA